MKVREIYKNNIYVDVDRTLVRWVLENPELKDHPKKFTVIDPFDGERIELVPIEKTFTIMREAIKSGKNVIVWSYGGEPWARAVMLAMGLDFMVKTYLTKPTIMVDDISPQENMSYVHWIPIASTDK